MCCYVLRQGSQINERLATQDTEATIVDQVCTLYMCETWPLYTLHRHGHCHEHDERCSCKISELGYILSFEHTLFCCKCAISCDFAQFLIQFCE